MASPEWSEVVADGQKLFDAEWMAGRSGEVVEHVMRVGMGATPDGVSTPPPGATKLVGLLRYVPSLRRDDASEYWLQRHGDLALTISEIGHYVQNQAARPLQGDPEVPLRFDGYSEAWFEDQDTLQHAMDTDEWRTFAKDGPNLFDRSAFLSATVEERVLRGKED